MRISTHEKQLKTRNIKSMCTAMTTSIDNNKDRNKTKDQKENIETSNKSEKTKFTLELLE